MLLTNELQRKLAIGGFHFGNVPTYFDFVSPRDVMPMRCD